MGKKGNGRGRLLKQGCTYCGADATPLDHFPPRGFFEEPRGRLLEVPSCADCNMGASDDNEWLRNDLVLIATNAEHPSANHLAASAYRALSMPAKKGMRDAFMQTVQHREVRTEAGLHVTAPTFFLQAEPMRRVVGRIVKGLYWYHNSHARLPDEYTVSSFPVDESRKVDRQKTDSWVSMLLSQEKFTFGNNEEFAYSFRAISDDDPNVILWILVFYGRFAIVALTRKAANKRNVRRPEPDVP
jgi:hypothetical protein